MRTFLHVLSAIALTLVLSCDGDDGPDTSTTSSEQMCQSSHECINDVCTCTTPGMEDEECTDDEECEMECQVCE